MEIDTNQPLYYFVKEPVRLNASCTITNHYVCFSCCLCMYNSNGVVVVIMHVLSTVVVHVFVFCESFFLMRKGSNSEGNVGLSPLPFGLPGASASATSKLPPQQPQYRTKNPFIT